MAGQPVWIYLLEADLSSGKCEIWKLHHSSSKRLWIGPVWFPNRRFTAKRDLEHPFSSSLISIVQNKDRIEKRVIFISFIIVTWETFGKCFWDRELFVFAFSHQHIFDIQISNISMSWPLELITRKHAAWVPESLYFGGRTYFRDLRSSRKVYRWGRKRLRAFSVLYLQFVDFAFSGTQISRYQPVGRPPPDMIL